jgi:hypothetical protein
MIEFLVGNYMVDRANHNKKIKEGFIDEMDSLPLFDMNEKGAVAALIVSLIISFITAYIAYQCNSGENAGVRFIVTLFAFFFSGFYLVYYFIVYIIFDAQCSGTKDFLTVKRKTDKPGKKKKSKRKS